MAHKERPKYIEKQLQEINDIFRTTRLSWKDHYSNDLFQWFTSYLIHHNWYRGFNMHYDVPGKNGEIIRALAGPDYETKDYYIQIW